MTGQLLHKDVSDQPFDMSGLTTTLRRILDYARTQNFTEVYGRNAPWDGFQEAEEFDSYAIAEVYTSVLNDVYDICDAKTPEEKTYCQTIFHDVGYHGIRDIWAPAPIPWWKVSEPTLAMSRPCRPASYYIILTR